MNVDSLSKSYGTIKSKASGNVFAWDTLKSIAYFILMLEVSGFSASSCHASGVDFHE
jgi:hypothetical protein